MQNIPLNQINPKKLLHSKWTAAFPRNREKHFLVTRVNFDESGEVTDCLLEAVLSHREETIDWQCLKDASQWLQGWH